MAHRLRDAMHRRKAGAMGGNGKNVEADETIGKENNVPKRRSRQGNIKAVMTLVERGGAVRSFHIDATISQWSPRCEGARPGKRPYSDEGKWYRSLARK